MNEVKNIILARIEWNKKVKWALGQRQTQQSQGERERFDDDTFLKIRQSDWLELENEALKKVGGSEKMPAEAIEQLGTILGQICHKNDPSSSFVPINQKQIIHLLTFFFNKNGLQHKIPHLQVFTHSSFSYDDCHIILSWILEWSRKQYNYYQHLRNKLVAKYPDKNTIESFSQEICKKKEKYNQNIIPPKQYLSLFNRTSILSCVLAEIQEYYSLVGIEGLDVNYVKQMRKRGNKFLLAEEKNLSKAGEILLRTKENKNIFNQMRNYSQNYFTTFPNSSIHNSTVIKEIKKNHSQVPSLKRSQKEQEKKDLPNTDTLNFHKIERTKHKIEQKQQKRKRCRTLEQPSESVLPCINPRRKKEKDQNELNNLIKFPISQVKIFELIEEKESKENSLKKIMSRSSIKGILIKNFIHKRVTTESRNIQPEYPEIDREQLCGKKLFSIPYIQKKRELSQRNQSINRKKSGDLRSLREKTQALLRNFQFMNRYS